MSAPRAVKGMHDLLPDRTAHAAWLEARFREVARRWGFGEIRTPVVEPTELFVRSIGESTDIVEKEMYSFVDKGQDALTLRPEGTAGVVRAYVEHAVWTQEPVTRWIYMGPMFRRERPARGRYRQFHQLGAELFGDPGPYADAELIDMLVTFLREAGVADVEVLLNSLGGPEARRAYRHALVEYLEPRRPALSADSQRRLASNPLRVLDSKAPEDREVVAHAPRITDFLNAEDRAHLDGLRAALDRLQVPHRLEPTLVRGLDYYDRTLFEVRGRGGELGAQDAVCGGGRYDGLVETMGGPPTPAVGFAIGLERLMLLAPPPPPPPGTDVFVVAVGAAERLEAAVIARELRAEGLSVETDLRGGSLRSQLRRADRVGARLALLVGSDELARGVVQLRDLRAGRQREVGRDALRAAIRAERSAT
ncbi:MAG: histidine--tRNA ligase [Myxococcales bacterium]|nr:histidine--tRNA ligase [Myxococcales bacterium]